MTTVRTRSTILGVGYPLIVEIIEAVTVFELTPNETSLGLSEIPLK
jgi:hypothetical protein